MNKQQESLCVAVLMGICIYFLMPEANGLTHAGVSLLSVFIPTIYLWLTCGTGWTSLLSITMVVLLQVYDGTSAYMTLWGNICAAAVIPFLMISTVLEESGAFEWIVKWIISRKYIHARPTLFLIMMIFSMVIISVFTAPQVVAVLFFNLLGEVTMAIGYTKEDAFYTSHGLVIGWISQICDGILIWGRPYLLTMVAVVAGLGFTKFTVVTYFQFAFFYLLLAIAVILCIVKLWIRPDLSKFVNYDDAKMRRELKEKPISKRGKIALAGMVMILSCYVLASFQTYFSKITIAGSVTLICALLCVITVDGKPVMDLNKAAAKVPWSMIFFLGAIMFYAGTVGSDVYGISACLQNVLSPMIGNMPVFIAIFMGLAFASVATNFCSNSVSGVVVCSSFIPALMSVSGMETGQILAFACGVIAICGTAICTVSACPTMSIVYSDIGIRYKGTAKYSACLCVCMVVITTFVLVPIFTYIF